MKTSSGNGPASKIPIFLLKTQSVPSDGYAEYFSREVDGGGRGFEARFVEVLEHTLLNDGMRRVKELVHGKEFGKGKNYGGLIFTSQRAVEAFAKIVDDGPEKNKHHESWPCLQDVPIYTVGPATSRALSAIPSTPPLQIFGSETGNGEALAGYILDHYRTFYPSAPTLPLLLFLVGESRRDIIPKTLADPGLPENKRIRVDEVEVYGTCAMQSFPNHFSRLLEETKDTAIRWVVVFSPTGCESMLRELGMLDVDTGRVRTGERGGGCGVRKGRRQTYIATIGPTTRDYLRRNFGFEPDVCAAKPSPEGVGEGIGRFMAELEELEEREK